MVVSCLTLVSTGRNMMLIVNVLIKGGLVYYLNDYLNIE